MPTRKGGIPDPALSPHIMTKADISIEKHNRSVRCSTLPQRSGPTSVQLSIVASISSACSSQERPHGWDSCDHRRYSHQTPITHYVRVLQTHHHASSRILHDGKAKSMTLFSLPPRRTMDEWPLENCLTFVGPFIVQQPSVEQLFDIAAWSDSGLWYMPKELPDNVAVILSGIDSFQAPTFLLCQINLRG